MLRSIRASCTEGIMHIRRSHGVTVIHGCRFAYHTAQDVLAWSPDQSRMFAELKAHRLGDLIGDKIDPMMLTVFPCLLRAVSTEDIEVLRQSTNHEALLHLIDMHVKSVGVPPSFEVLVSAAKNAVSSSASGVAASPPPLQALPAKGLAKPESPPVSGVTDWYSTEQAESSEERCQCKGNCASLCPAREGICPNKVVNVPGQKVPLCVACRCRQLGCYMAARRPFGANVHPSNYGKCVRHQIKSSKGS